MSALDLTFLFARCARLLARVRTSVIAHQCPLTRLSALDVSILAFATCASTFVTALQCFCTRSAALNGVRIVLQVTFDALKMVAGQSYIHYCVTVLRARSGADRRALVTARQLTRAFVRAYDRKLGFVARYFHLVTTGFKLDNHRLLAFAALFVAHLVAVMAALVLFAARCVADVVVVAVRVTKLLARVAAVQSVLARESAATVFGFFTNVESSRDHAVVLRVILTAQFQSSSDVVVHHHHVDNVAPQVALFLH